MIKFTNVTKAYGNTQIIKESTFDIALGKITCVLGDSGAGKTTLLNILANTLKIDSGVIENLPPKSSYAFQEHCLISSKTVKENLTLFTGETNQQNIENLLEKVDLLDKINAYVCTLSGGEKQRVNIVRAMLKNAPLILLDEPFNALDLSLKLKVAKILKSHVKSKNLTAVIVTHDVSMAEFLSDEILIIKEKISISIDVESKMLTI